MSKRKSSVMSSPPTKLRCDTIPKDISHFYDILDKCDRLLEDIPVSCFAFAWKHRDIIKQNGFEKIAELPRYEIKFLFEDMVYLPTMKSLAQEGFLTMMKFVYFAQEHEDIDWEDTIEEALYTRHYDIVPFAIDHGALANKFDILDNILQSNNMELIRWARDQYTFDPKESETDVSLFLSAFNAQEPICDDDMVTIVAYLHEEGCPWDEKLGQCAAMMGYVKTLKYVYDHGCPFANWILDVAGEFQQSECINYLTSIGFKPTFIWTHTMRKTDIFNGFY